MKTQFKENNTSKVTRLGVGSANSVVVIVDQPIKTYEAIKSIFLSNQVIWYVLGFIGVLLDIRVALKIAGANALSPLVNMIYFLSDPLTVPFQRILGALASSSSFPEWSTFVAILVYSVVALGIVELSNFVSPTHTQ